MKTFALVVLALHSTPLSEFAPSNIEAAPCCVLTPEILRDHYGQPNTATRRVVVISPYQWIRADVETYSEWVGASAVLTDECVGLLRTAGCTSDATASLESTLNAELVLVGASRVDIHQVMPASPSARDMTMAYAAAARHANAVVLTTWVACERALPLEALAAMHASIEMGVSLGQRWIVASGDGGRYGCDKSLGVTFPAASPASLGVGGTDLDCSGSCSEGAWVNSGGGESLIFARPSWQEGCATPASAGRLVPDISASASPEPGVAIRFQGSWRGMGGTSVAAPILAGYLATRAVEESAPASWYERCETLVDIVDEDHGALPGFDTVTGLGSPRFFTGGD